MNRIVFYDSSKYVNFNSFKLPIKNQDPEKIFLVLDKEGKYPKKGRISLKIGPMSISEAAWQRFQAPFHKNGP